MNPDLLAPEKSPTEGKDAGYFSQIRQEIEVMIPDKGLKILDVGCGAGALGKRLLEKGAKEVTGIEITAEICEEARKNLSQVICSDIENLSLDLADGYFDCMIFADILEHLIHPRRTLRRMKKYLSDSGFVVASIPNVRHYGVLLMLLEGRWEYADWGILDRNHLRFFTKKEMEHLFAETGFEIIGINENIHPQFYSMAENFSGEISLGRFSIKGLTFEDFKDLFVGQYLIKAKKKPVPVSIDAIEEMGRSQQPDVMQEQIKEVEDHLALQPLDANVLLKHAVLCHQAGLIEKALESLDKILLVFPEHKDARALKTKLNL